MIHMKENHSVKNSSHGFVKEHRGNYYIDRTKKLGTLIPNEIILYELIQFLSTHYSSRHDQCILDAGAGTKPYLPVYQKYFSSCISFDMSTSPHNITCVDLISSATALPFQSDSFDCIVCTEVLEHVPEPINVLKEFRRVLKKNGMLFLTTPFLVPLHEMPTDYYRYTPSALHYMAKQAGLTVENIVAKGGYSAFALLQMQFLMSKSWQIISRVTHLHFYHPLNPLVFIFIILPQLIYIKWWKKNRVRQKTTLQTERYNKLSHVTLGYVTVLLKL
jgi:SAM-dependent methyltransferase